MKQVAVLGLGDFGLALALQLKENGVSVLAADMSRARVDLVRDELDYIVIADITQASALNKLRLPAMDVVVVATSSPLPSSILCVLRLKDLGVKSIYAKAENKDHAIVLKALGVNEILIPEQDTATRLANKLSWTSVLEMFEFSEGCGIMEIAVPAAVAGKAIRDSGLREHSHVQVLGIRQWPGAPLEPIPNPDHVLGSRNTLVVFGEESHLARLRQEAERK